MQTSFTRALDLRHPIVQAPMAGANATPPELVAAVSEHGALGFVGAAYMSPDEIRSTCRDIKSKTDRPFGVNLFVPAPLPAIPSADTRARGLVAAYHAELGIPAPAPPVAPKLNFDEQLDAALNSGARVFSTTFGALSPDRVAMLKARSIFVIGTATTVAEAVELERTGVDAIVAQGNEAGGHRGTFAAPFEESMIGGLALVPQIVDAVRVPVLASGGIMDGRGIVASLALGAAAVQMGTAFLACDECGVLPAYKDAIIDADAGQTRVTYAFSGRAARGIVNRFMRETEAAGDDAILPFPYQNDLTRAMRTAAAKQGRIEFLSLWAGQGAHLARRQSAAELIRRLASEMDVALDALDRQRSDQ
ncbi:MAG TPA: nitronate monooxygenase [Gemmatimonadaceae bacterium]|jgi:nitronate monooxygenase